MVFPTARDTLFQKISFPYVVLPDENAIFNNPYRLGTYRIVWILQLPGSKLYELLLT